MIFDSSVALLQGLFPSTVRILWRSLFQNIEHSICHQSANSIQLSNGTNVTSPLGGYQYVPIESVEPEEDVSLEGFMSCNVRLCI